MAYKIFELDKNGQVDGNGLFIQVEGALPRKGEQITLSVGKPKQKRELRKYLVRNIDHRIDSQGLRIDPEKDYSSTSRVLVQRVVD